MEVMTFNVDKDRRNLTDDTQNFDIDFSDSKYSWLAARQYENQMRQVQLNMQHGDGSPLDLTGANVVFEGLLPDGEHRIVDAKHSTILDAVNGQARFDFPAQAFTVSGSYKQAFFRVYRNGMNVASLEFSLEVYADKVISGLIPADYITPFLDLYGQLSDIIANATGDLKVALQTWVDKFQDAFTTWNGSYEQMQVTVSSVKSQLVDLETAIKSDDLMTVADFLPYKTQITAALPATEAADSLTDMALVDDSDDVNGGITDLSRLQAFKQGIDQTKLNIAFQTDVHVERYSNWRPHMDSGLRHVLNPMYLQDKLAAIVFNGDNINNGSGYPHAQANALVKDFSTTVWSLSDAQTPVLINKGNHDNNYKDSSTYADFRTKPSEALLNAELATYFGYNRADKIIRNGKSAYGYLDFDNFNVRAFMLDSYDLPESVDEDGYLDFDGRHASIFSQTQLQWVANNLDPAKQTILFTHNPIKDVFGTYTAAAAVNHDLLKSLLEAFVDGGSGTLNGTNGTAIKYSFSTKGTIIGVFTGHLHHDGMVVDHGIQYVESTCSAVYDDEDAVQDRANQYGTYAEDAFDVIQIDPTTRQVQLKRFGYGLDRSYAY